MKTDNWPSLLDSLVFDAFIAGRVSGAVCGAPSEVIESGLAHIFFYGEKVFKLYKTNDDKDHFIKGVLAPAEKRKKFLEHDFSINSHFSPDIYLMHHGVQYDFQTRVVQVVPYDGLSIYSLVEMRKLDIKTNLHEKLLANKIDDELMYTLGKETARAIDTCPIQVSAEENWYNIATQRVAILRQFIDWMDTEYRVVVLESGVIDELERHLEKNKEEYLTIDSSQLSVNMDNHDENIFFIAGKPQFIDLLPPMSCWWYGLPYANLSNIMVNVETLHSPEAAQRVKDGYVDYHQGAPIPDHLFGFTHAFSYLISIAHFSSVPGKQEVTKKYLKRLPDISSWL